MIFGPITFIQISRSREGENFGGDTEEDKENQFQNLSRHKPKIKSNNP